MREWRQLGGGIVRDKVQAACAAKCRITLQADAWGSKGTSRTHYLAILASWIDSPWPRLAAATTAVAPWTPTVSAAMPNSSTA